MIYLELKGRLGNQFFRYAYARWLQIKRGHDEELIIGLHSMKDKNKNEGWCDGLADFNVKDHIISYDRLVFKYGSPLTIFFEILFLINTKIVSLGSSKLKVNIIKKCAKALARFGLIHLPDEYMNINVPNTKDVFVDIGGQDPRYLKEVKDVLRKEFEPKYPLLESNRELYEVINSTNSICMSIRRGDYVTNEKFEKVYNVCSQKYYEKAFQIICSKVKNPTLIVFSDDISWAKENLKFDVETYFESGNDPIWEKVRLMSACKHFIISNSSFSWMTQFLSDYESKIVVSPSKWYKNEEFPCYLIQNDFIKVEV